ncbi:DJ-1/PfpI family protein [Fusobacterium gonidiaformans 3-1-5R]|mgnify:FL=1|uniref:DJ-1/PfpI family protein n=2 Tax=Fusobacterium TaxID=848 RepID=E5BEL6_9FUSO|nr:DJ-1/PfpI family protein [Fusobacterium gonidiaformans]AVQ17576.1 4-methyl-5(B-hydroxyethyl)-thiazole monophosphate biosynthesis protein [Fusobacterium gonidiaformans ATCC 25563]EFS20547.1 DJ-1/PfpI family protein [Fusobacterium gonidiaformans 3-1-5R]
MKKILLLLLPGVESMEFSPFLDIFGWNEMLGSKDIHLELCTLEKEVSSSWNLNLKVEKQIRNIELRDYIAVVIPGGFGSYHYFDTIENTEFRSFIQKAKKEELYILGICTGSILLASTGYFANKKMTTYLYENGRYSKQLSQYQVEFKNTMICKDDKLWTSSGPSTAIPMAFDLLEELSSRKNRKYIEAIMGF